MKKSQVERLTGFLQERLPPDAWGEVADMLDELQARYDDAGPDDTEVAMRTVDLIDFLNSRLPLDEMERVRKIIFGTDNQGNPLAADAALRVRCGLRAHNYARQRVAWATGVDTMACDSAADAYRLGLTALGHDASHIADDAARSVFEGFMSQRRAQPSSAADMATRFGVTTPRKLG